MIYRRATILDIQKIVELGQAYYDSIENIVYEYKPSYVATVLSEYLNLKENLILLAIDDGELVGILWGMALPVLPWTPTVSAIDILFFIKEPYRGTRISNRLIKMYEEWAKSMNCTEVLLGTSSGINMDRTIRFYERLGYTQFGTQLNKEL